MMNPSLKSPKFLIPRSITNVTPVNCCTWSGGWVTKAWMRKPLGYLQLNLDMQPNLSQISIRPIQASRAPYHNFDHFVHPVANGNPEAQCLGSRGEILKGRILLRPTTPGESSPLDDRSPQVGYRPSCQSPTLADNHQPYLSVTDQCTQASIPIPTFFGASTHSLIKHQPLFPHIVITHADSFLPNPAVAKFVCTLDLLLPHACFPGCLVLV